MIQAMDVEPHSTVLDLAGATGYSSAILAKLARKVVAIEPDAALAAAAKAALGDLGLANASVHQGAVAEGRTSEGPFDAILVNGAIADVPAALLDQLKAGGRLVAVMIRDGAGKAMVVTRTGGGYPALDIFDAAAAFVPGCAPKPAFSF
jgi:protein-L-isoaspartate(D-aspartate) O-methyltransferase